MKIEETIVDFLINHGTFWASMISQMVRVADTKTPTLHVQFSNGTVELHYNPDYLNPKSMKDSKALLEHECLHVAMDHFTRFKAAQEHTVAQVGTDLAINQMLTHIPEGGVTLENVFGPDFYKKVKANESAEYYYDLIMKDEKLKQKIKDQFGGEGGCNGQCKLDPNGKPDPNAKPHPHTCGETMDNHGDKIDPDLQREIIKQMVKEAANTAKANGQGHLPGGLEKLIDEIFKTPEVSWRQLLKRLVANSIRSGKRLSWKRPSRRFGETQKGKVADRTVSIVVAIDTSGSIDDGMLTDFINEIRCIQSCYKTDIHMIECDAQVQKYYKLRKTGKVDRNIQGRGGTDFVPVFEYIKDKKIKCDVLVFFTDLAGSFPDKKPTYPVIWGYYSYGWGSSGKAPFGHVITLKKEKQNESE